MPGGALSNLFNLSTIRTEEGLTDEIWSARTSECSEEELRRLPTSVLADSERCRAMAERGILIVDEDGLRLSAEGILLADHVIPDVINCLQGAAQRRREVAN